VENSVPALQRALEPFVTPESGAGWMRLPAGRVLVHAGHVSQGVFVAVSGLLWRSDDRGLSVAVAAPCVVPPLDQWLAPSLATWTLKSGSELLFVPRSRLLEPSEYRDALERLLLALIVRPDHSAEDTR
jgi:hypothetical protein